MNKFSLTGVLLGAWALAMEAHATCFPGPALNVGIAAITVPANAQVGQVLGSASGYAFASPSGSAIRCPLPPIFSVAGRLSIVNSSSTQRTFSAGGLSMTVYATNVPGVGFAMMARDPNWSWMAINHTGVTLLNSTGIFKQKNWGLEGRIYLVVTGAISGGTITSRNIARYALTNVIMWTPGYYAVNLGNVTINPPLKPTCRVTTPSIAMPLATVASRDFRGIGSYTGSVTRNITLSCAGGTGGTRDVFITVTDQTTRANRSNVLSLTSSSKAKGVALQLLRGTTLVSYGADSSTIGNTNQWLVGSTGNATVQIPLTARYIQTAASIQPGSANGAATFTMAYR